MNRTESTSEHWEGNHWIVLGDVRMNMAKIWRIVDSDN